MTRFLVPAALSAVFLAAAPNLAEAHARLLSSNPAAGATVAAPRSIALTFSERSVPAFSGLELVNAQGARTEVRTSTSQDGKVLTGALARPLSAGVYTLNWRIASGDGHRMTGSFSFTVR
ncbi:MAG: copper homeostasis periplasmic binding protein CopC [Brevundimonas sp.]|uniref:copper homeostasis periplasmic binding protein CopC n=1 Tax=Brevundimonas sp. TaxID=1871086 RepID=UPI00258A3AA8|nr:copper homeostasis periplasmic binding protein CopC [Brevundimonas sp.]MCV0415690.1 copper homeostasis periplasmic binding protein CopC [Brevundimonas sp.]